MRVCCVLCVVCCVLCVVCCVLCVSLWCDTRKELPNPQAPFGLLLDPQRAAIAMEFLDYKTPDLFAFHFNDLVPAPSPHAIMPRSSFFSD